MRELYFYSEQPIGSETVELTGTEHQHLSKVLRLGVGDIVTLIDGSGYEFSATIVGTARSGTRLRIDSREQINRELPYRLSIAVALPKGDRQQWLIEKCVELGVSRLIPLITERGVAQPGEKARKRIDRWVVAATKQCRRTRLMQIGTPQTVVEYCAPIDSGMDRRLFLHPGADHTSLASCIVELPSELTELSIIIGPEGGFTDDEVAIAHDQGCPIVSLGERVLRIETAAVASAAAVVLARSG